MTKSSTALMSLIAAVPGGILVLLLVWAFLGHADDMGGMLNAVVGIALLCGVAAALMPVGIVIFGGPKGPAKVKAPKPPKEPKAKKEKKGKKSKDVPVDDEDEAGAADSAVDLDEADEDSMEGSSSDMVEEFDADDSGELLIEEEEDLRKPQAAADWDDSDDALSDEFEFDDALSDDELEFDFDDED